MSDAPEGTGRDEDRPERKRPVRRRPVQRRENGSKADAPARRRPTTRAAGKKGRRRSRGPRVIEELPPIGFVLGGEQRRWFIPTCLAAFLLMAAIGGVVDWRKEYSDVPEGFSGTPKQYHDCVPVHYTYGDRNSTSHDPMHPDNLACAELSGDDPNYSELEYQAWLADFLASVATDDGNHSGYVWSEQGLATMAYLVSTMGSNMSVYFDPVAGDEFNGTHLAIWNSATTAFGGGNDSFEDLLPGGGTAMAMYVGAGGIVSVRPTGYVWTEAGLATMAYLWALNGANMSMYGDPVAGDVFTQEHLGIWNAATVAFGGGNDSFDDLLPGGATAMSLYVGPNGIVGIAPTGFVWTEEGLSTMAYLWAMNGANMSMYGDPVAGDVFTEEHLGIWNAATVAFGGGTDAMEDLVPGGASAMALYIGAGGIVLWSNLTEMPHVTNVTVAPAAPTADDVPSCSWDFTDPQGDADASTVRWYVNGMPVGSEASAVVVASGDTLSCSVLPFDGVNPGFRVHGTPVTVA